MTTGKENNASWLDDITELIRKKQEENLALRKVQESLRTMDVTKENSGAPLAIEEEQTLNNDNDQSI